MQSLYGELEKRLSAAERQREDVESRHTAADQTSASLRQQKEQLTADLAVEKGRSAELQQAGSLLQFDFTRIRR